MVALVTITLSVVFGLLYQPSGTSDPGSTTSPQHYNLNFSSTECGVPAIKPILSTARIVGGVPAVAHSWPWTVSIGVVGPTRTMNHICGGSLINNHTVLTAAHCVEKEEIFTIGGQPDVNVDVFKDEKSMLRIFVGTHTRSKDNTEQSVFLVKRILIHAEYDPITYKNDIAILTLEKDVEVSEKVSFICLSRKPKIETELLHVVGWGFTETNFFSASDELRQVSVPLKLPQDCKAFYIPGFQFCAGGHSTEESKRKDSCNGDSGGPAMLYEDERYVLAGIVSNGDSACTGQGIYTNVAIYYDWIGKNIQ